MSLADTVEYLWINMEDRTQESADLPDPDDARVLTQDEWLNVIDEAAALGVHCLVAFVGKSLSRHPDIWPICQWAQGAHGMMVGIHTSANSFAENYLQQLQQLNLAQMCLFVSKPLVDSLGHLQQRGINICAASVTEEDHTPPCDMPKCMVCVDRHGHLYTCGLVLGQQQFCLGSVLEGHIEDILNDEELPREVPVRPEGCNCDACPPVMAERVAKTSNLAG